MIPASASEIEEMTPDGLKNIVPTPLFRFRPATERDQRRYWHLLTRNNVTMHSNDAIRIEILRALKANWPEESYEKQRETLDTFWAKIDQEMEIQDDEAIAYNVLVKECMRLSLPLAEMVADNQLFEQEAPLFALSMFLVGWTNVDVPFALDAGLVDFERLGQLARALKAIEEKAVEDKIEGASPGVAMMQLATHAFQLMSLDREETKNSDAPSSSVEGLNGSTSEILKDGASPTAPAKTSSSSRKKTRPTSSPATSPA